MIKQVEGAAYWWLSVFRLLKPPSGTALVATQLPRLLLILHNEIFEQRRVRIFTHDRSPCGKAFNG
jgi:hypothetical protein